MAAAAVRRASLALARATSTVNRAELERRRPASDRTLASRIVVAPVQEEGESSARSAARAVDEALDGMMPRSELDKRIVARDALLVSALTGRSGSGEARCCAALGVDAWS